MRTLLAKTHRQHTKSVSFEHSSFTPEAHSHERTFTQESVDATVNTTPH